MGFSSPRRIRVLHVLPSLEAGGAVWRISEMTAAACRDGQEWGIVYFTEPSATRSFLEAAGVKVFGPFCRSPRSWRNTGHLLRSAREFGAEIIHAHSTWPGLWAARLRGRFLGPLVFGVRGLGVPYPGPWAARSWLYRYIYARVDWVVCVAQWLQREILRLAPQVASKCSVIYNGIDQQRLRPQKTREQMRRELGVSEGQRLICAVGNIEKIKGHDVAIRALALLHRRFPEAVLVIAGRAIDPAFAQHLQALAAQLGLQDAVAMIGQRSDIADLLAATDVFIMPSHSEGLPGALLEALFMGRPVVASDVGGIPEIVEAEKTGLLVPAGDAEALAAGIERLLADPDFAEELGRRGQAAVRQRFTLEAMYTNHCQLYERLLDARAR
jgi:glycosyltransferase involved in cell wall biosynthesis